ncbi:MAG: hypothetical protein ABI831_12860 [Betaproteobacteria bacterium]
MKFLPLIFLLLVVATLSAQFLVVISFELRCVDELSRWLGHGIFSAIAALRQFGGIATRWDIASFAFCVSTTFAIVSCTVGLNRRRAAQFNESA